MDLLTHLTTLVAAFSGAWFAFLLNDRPRRGRRLANKSQRSIELSSR